MIIKLNLDKSTHSPTDNLQEFKLLCQIFPNLLHLFDEMNSRFHQLIRCVFTRLDFQSIDFKAFREFCTRIITDHLLREHMRCLRLSHRNHTFNHLLFFIRITRIAIVSNCSLVQISQSQLREKRRQSTHYLADRRYLLSSQILNYWTIRCSTRTVRSFSCANTESSTFINHWQSLITTFLPHL